MTKDIVLTLTGHDRVGIVDQITDLFVKHGGNVETSRMAHLGGEFAMLALVSFDDKELPALESEFNKLREEGFQITLVETEDDHAKKYAGWLPYKIEVLGADHEGIIHKVTHHLAQQDINIEDMETSTSPAPMSGTPLFRMEATVLAPPNLPFHKWSDSLEEIGDNLNVNIEVTIIK